MDCGLGIEPKYWTIFHHVLPWLFVVGSSFLSCEILGEIQIIAPSRRDCRGLV